jgi:hypothetical protein
MLNTDNLFDDENKEGLKEAGSADLLAKLSGAASNRTGTQALRAGVSFEEMTRQKWNEFRYANKDEGDLPANECESLPFKADFYTDGINFLKLIQFIKVDYSNIFDFTKFQGIRTHGSHTSTSPTTMVPVTSSYSSIGNVPFEYTDRNGKNRKATISGSLNKRVCYLEQSPPNLQSGWRFELDAENEKSNLTLSFYYKGTYQLRRDLVNTPEQNDYTLEDQYRAIILSTKSGDDFVALMKEIHGDYIGRETAKGIAKKYVNTLNACNDAVQLKFLYNNIPAFVIEDIKNNGSISADTLWNHVILLTEYDDTGLFSFVKDASSALINVLKALGDSAVLYKKLVGDPLLIRRIYYNLDGSSEINGQAASNRIIFSCLLASLCSNNNYEGLTPTEKTFRIGTNYKLDANVKGGGEGNDGFFLQQLKSIPPGGMDFMPEGLWEDITDGTGAVYKPLDIVYLIDTSAESEIPIPVPAIYIKALSDEAEWQEIEKNIRLGFDVLGLILGVVTVLTTGNPLVFALAVADIGITVTDITVQTFHAEIEAMEGGKRFLAIWERIYLVGNLITASPAIIGSLFKLGTGLLKVASTVKNFNVRNFIMAIFTRIIIERNIAAFAKNTVREIVYWEEALVNSGIRVTGKGKKFIYEVKGWENCGIKFNLAGISRLQQAGVLFITALNAEKKVVGYAAIYKGEAIASGTAKEVRDALKEIWEARGTALLEKLELLWKRSLLLKPIKSETELITLLGKLDETIRVGDLEKAGIKALFRGTTRDLKGKLFSGNANTIKHGLSVSTDPVRGVIFGIESASKGGRKGFLQVTVPSNLKDIGLQIANRRYEYELEAVVKTSAKNFSKLANKEIPIQKARELVNQFFKLPENIPSKLDFYEAERLIKQLPKSTLEESFRFYQEIIKL